MRPTSCEEAAVEWDTFTFQEKAVYDGLLSLLQEDLGREPKQAERDAAAAILEHRRLSKPPDFTAEELEAIKVVARGYMQTKKLKAAEAERLAYKEALEKKAKKGAK